MLIRSSGSVQHHQSLLFMDGVFLIESRRRKILCVFCMSDVESWSCNHILFSCLFAYGVWTSIYRLLGFEGAFDWVDSRYNARSGLCNNVSL
jgi:hypothetical protein